MVGLIAALVLASVLLFLLSKQGSSASDFVKGLFGLLG